MADQQWQDTWEIFHRAVELPPDARDAFLASACGSDADLRREVEQLLAAHSDAGPLDRGPATLSSGAQEPPPSRVETLRQTPASEPDQRPSAPVVAPGRPEEELLGTRIGTIRLLDLLGKGGMGEVYLARDEKLKRQVAVKCIRAEHAFSADVKARFLQEAQILSRLKHPGICQIHDYIEGEDNDFLVLEYIEGKTLQQAMQEDLTERAKMRVALELADVLIAAHAKNVVHRDLKPGNIMLTSEGEVKVLDFGLARSLDDQQRSRIVSTVDGSPPDSTVELAAKIGSLQTQTGILMGTPEYMSPEQARSEPITPASDIYSFGLILHRMFTGRPPYGTDLHFAALFRKATLAETEPVVGVDRELAALIERLTSLAPGSRPSASDTAERLRWIRDAPARRRARGVRVAAFVALALIAALMTFQSFRIRQEADRAQQEKATTEEVLDLFVSLFEVSDPSEARGREITAREILDRGARRISYELEDQPAVRARLLDSIGVIYTKLGLFTDSEPLLEEALTARRSTPGGEPQVAASLGHLAYLRMAQGRLDEADRLNAEALEIRERLADVERGVGGEELAETLHQRGQLFAVQGKFEAAEPLLQRALEVQELGEDTRGIALTLTDLALLYEQQGRFGEAEKLHRRAVAIREQLGPDRPELAESLNGLAIVYDQQGEPERARPLWERALEISEKTLDPGHPQTALIQMNLAAVRVKLGDLAAAEPLYEQALASFEKTFGSEHPNLANGLANLANLRVKQGRYPEAESLFRRAHAIFEQALGPEHPAVAMAQARLGWTYAARRRYAEAEPFYQRALGIFERKLGGEHPQVASTLDSLTSLYAKTGRLEEALSASQRARTIAENALGPDHQNTALFTANFGDLERLRGELDEAEVQLLRARAALEASLGPDDPKLVRALRGLANVYRDRGEASRAEPLYLRCAEILAGAYGEDHPVFVELYEDHAQLLRLAGRSSEASRLEKRARDLAQTFGLVDRPRP